VTRAVALCRAAGIKVRMVTGDNIVIARVIAKECGIIEGPDSIEMQGHEFMSAIGGVVCSKCR